MGYLWKLGNLFGFVETCEMCNHSRTKVIDTQKVDFNKTVTGKRTEILYCEKMRRNLQDLEPCDAFIPTYPYW